MIDGTPSRTAQWVAAARAMGMLLPDDVRLADDSYGAEFTSPRLARLVRSRAARAFGSVPGMKTWIAYMQVRTKVLDDAVRAFVADGGRQLVLLGAGYDCRALRLAELRASRVFEVDHPATQTHKRTVLARLGADSRATYLAWDFEARPMAELPDALAAAGLARSAATLTIWEGVTMYLTEPAIDASLRAIAAYSGAGSQLAMTYFARSRLAKPSLATRSVQAVVARLGEPFRWGWEPAELPAYLAARGFAVDDDLAMPEAAAALLPPGLAATVRRADSRIALASRS